MSTIKVKNPETGLWEHIGLPVEAKGMQMDLLWTNPDVTVEFPGQDISVNTIGYDGLLIAWYGRNADMGSGCGSETLMFNEGRSAATTWTNSGKFITRGIAWLDRHIIRVYDCCMENTYGDTSGRVIMNTDAIPYQIYGIRNTSSSNSTGDGTTESINHPGCFYRMVNGVQEWLNPPMVAGIEYKLTKRFNGRPVYTTLVDFGALPEGFTYNGKIHTECHHNIADIERVLKYYGYHDNQAVNCNANFTAIASPEEVYFFSDAALTGFKTAVALEYLKTTD